MFQPIDFKEFNKPFYLDHVIDLLGIVGPDGERIRKRGHCPLCGGPNPSPRALSVDCKRGVWYCHGCQEYGNGLTMFHLWSKLGIYQAAIGLCKAINCPVPILEPVLQGVTTQSTGTGETTPGLAYGNNCCSEESQYGQSQLQRDYERLSSQGFPAN